jgi:hypothetical protein
MRGYPNVDHGALGLLGFGSGGITALLTQMRNTDVDAVADLGGALAFGDIRDTIQRNPYYSVVKMQVPLLVMYSDLEYAPDFSLIDSLKYSSRYLCEVNELRFVSFCSIGRVLGLVPDSAGTVPGSVNPGHEAVCQYTMNFFNAQLNGDLGSLQFLSDPSSDDRLDANLLEVSIKRAEKAPPTPRQFMHVIAEYGAHRAAEIYDKFKLSHPGSITFPEATMNYLGYERLRSNSVEEATVLFRLNAEAYPNSANCWDSYADACIAAGDTEGAIRCYKKVLEVLPNDPNASERLKETLRNNAEQGLERLER